MVLNVTSSLWFTGLAMKMSVTSFYDYRKPFGSALLVRLLIPFLMLLLLLNANPLFASSSVSSSSFNLFIKEVTTEAATTGMFSVLGERVPCKEKGWVKNKMSGHQQMSMDCEKECLCYPSLHAFLPSNNVPAITLRLRVSLLTAVSTWQAFVVSPLYKPPILR